MDASGEKIKRYTVKSASGGLGKLLPIERNTGGAKPCGPVLDIDGGYGETYAHV